jgi:hypothetical protein
VTEERKVEVSDLGCLPGFLAVMFLVIAWDMQRALERIAKALEAIAK